MFSLAACVSTQGCIHGNGAIELANLLGEPNRKTKLIVKQVVKITVTKIRNFREHYLAASTEHQGSMQHASYPAIVATFQHGREPIFIGGLSDFKRMVFRETADQRETRPKIDLRKSAFNLTRNGRGRATVVPHRLSTSNVSQSRRIIARVQPNTTQAVQPQVTAPPVPPQIILPPAPQATPAVTPQVTQAIPSRVTAPPVPPQVMLPPASQATLAVTSQVTPPPPPPEVTPSQARTHISRIRFPSINHRIKKCTIF